jgi:drug/metabolite transporter (DMT)-like permease
MNWLIYSLMTAFFFGIYGVLLHSGSMGMKDSVNGRYKAFLFVGVAYFLVAVLVPLILLKFKGAEFTFPTAGWSWSLAAGVAGAIGAFGILLAFGAKGIPSAVMSIVFAGAPIVNAFVSMSLHPPQGGLRAVPWQFMVGIVLAAVGGCLVALYKPNPAPPAAHASVQAPAAVEMAAVE